MLVVRRVGGSVISKLTEAYGVCGWVGLEYLQAYEYLRWEKVEGLEIANCLRMFTWVWWGG